MGPLENILGMLPGMSNVQGLSVDEKQLKRTEAIVLSMTQRGADAPRHFKCAASSAHRPRQRLHRHRGKRFAPALRSDAKDDEEHGQNEKDDGANGAR